MLLKDWRKTLVRAWSIRLMLLAALLSGIEAALPYFEPSGRWRGAFAALSGLVTIAALIARLTAQPKTLPNEKAE